MPRFIILAPEAFTGTRIERNVCIVVDPPNIVDVVDERGIDRYRGLPEVRLPAGTLLAPGFIDVQVNGGGGVLLNDQPTLDGIRAIAAAHRRYGTTGLLPTLITDAPEVMDRLADVAADALHIPGVLGFHLEGPHISPKRKGVHREDLIRPLDETSFARLARFGRIGRTVVTLAPECVPIGTIRRLVDAGLIVSIGHSNATIAEMELAAREGAVGVTHLFNAMSQISPREPGVVGGALGLAGLYAGIIADGHHVHDSNLWLARAMLFERLMLVTDAMPSVGAPNDGFVLQGRTIALRDGRLVDETGTLAGAHLSMIDAVRHMARVRRGWPDALTDALKSASQSPAAFLDLSDRRGRIQAGSLADLAAFDRTTFTVVETWIGGSSGS